MAVALVAACLSAGYGLLESRGRPDVPTALLKAEAMAEISHQFQMYETLVAISPFPYSDQADQWHEHAQGFVKHILAKRVHDSIATSGKAPAISSAVALRDDSWGQPVLRLSVDQKLPICYESEGTTHCGMPSSALHYLIRLRQVDGRWRVDHIEPVGPPVMNPSLLAYLCYDWTVEDGWDGCPGPPPAG